MNASWMFMNQSATAEGLDQACGSSHPGKELHPLPKPRGPGRQNTAEFLHDLSLTQGQPDTICPTGYGLPARESPNPARAFCDLQSLARLHTLGTPCSPRPPEHPCPHASPKVPNHPATSRKTRWQRFSV